MKYILSRSWGWLAALAAAVCLGAPSAARAQQSCPLTFSPYPAQLSSYVTVYPYYNVYAGPQQQLESWFLIDVPTSIPNSPIPYGMYPAWCVDEATAINAGYTVPGTYYTGTLYASCDPNLNSELPPGHPNTLVSAANWQMVNYILNNQVYNGTNAFYWNVQAAINTLVGSAVGSPDPCGGLYTTPTPSGECEGYPVYDPVVVQGLLTAASNNAPSFVPQCGNVIGAIYVIGTNNQFLVIEIPVPCTACVGVTEQIACLQPTNSCGAFAKVAEGYAGSGCIGSAAPAFCYQITVTNCGTIPLSNVVVLDNLLGNLTTNFFTNQSQIFAPGAAITATFSMPVPSTSTNSVTVTGTVSLSQSATNGSAVYTNGSTVTASDSALAIVDSASLSCSVSLYSPLDLDGNTNDNNVTLPAASYYSSSPTVTLSVTVCNTGLAPLTGVTIAIPAIAGFNCTTPAPFNLAAGTCQTFQLCAGLVSCPASVKFNLNVTGQAGAGASHCSSYDLTGTNAITACSSCTGSISCSTNTGCLAGTGNLIGSVLLHCVTSSTNISGDTGLVGIPVVLFGSAGTPLATNVTAFNGSYAFNNLASGTYYVLATVPTNDVQTYPIGISGTKIPVTISVCTNAVINIGYAEVIPPVITVPPGTSLGCNPTNVPTDSSETSMVKVSASCGSATVTVTHLDSTNGCTLTRTFTIIVKDVYGNGATNSSVVYTWTADSTVPILSGVPLGKSLGCNPTNIPTAASLQATIMASDTCSPATVHVIGLIVTNGCSITQIFTITATNLCGNMALAHVTNTWSADSVAPVLSGVPVGKYLGCNPTNVPTVASLQATILASDTCSPATVHVTVAVSTNVCAVTQIFSITATNVCGNIATASLTNTWTANTNTPVLMGVPASVSIGCAPTNLPTDTNVSQLITASSPCGSAMVTVTHQDATNGCYGMRVFTIEAVDGCGNVALTNFVYAWNSGNGPVIICPTNVFIQTNLCKLACSFTPGDWNSPCIGYNTSGSNLNNWVWNWTTGWTNIGKNWWGTWSQTNTSGSAWSSWSNWWTVCNGTNPGTNWWGHWTNVGNGNQWSGCWTSQSNNWWSTWASTYNKQSWVPCAGNNPGDILTNWFSTVYTNGCVKIGSNGYCLTFTSPAAIRTAMGWTGTPGLLNCSATNATTCSAGSFCAQVLALQLNCDFGDYTNAPDFFGHCGDAVLTDSTSPCNGLTVRGILGLCHTAIGCGSLPAGCTISNLCSLVSNLNQCFEGCQVSPWCASHCTPVYIPPASRTGTPTVTDTCSPNPTVCYTDSVTNLSCQGGYVITRVWTAVDSCGHSNYCNQTITIDQGSSAAVSGVVVLACSGDSNLGNNPGLSGATVTLKNSGGTIVATTVTSSSGAYAFTSQPSGNYTVTVTAPSGYTLTTASASQSVSLSGCQSVAGVNFSYTGSSPAVQLTKTGPVCIATGQTAVYSFTVTNTGNTCLSLSVNDPLLGGVISSQASVPPGSGYTFTGSYVVTKTNGILTNTAWALGTTPSGTVVSNQASVTTTVTTRCVTNTICEPFYAQLPQSGWIWCNANLACRPNKKATIFCQNASITATFMDGTSATYPLANGQINFSPTCTVATNWFDGVQWNTTLPCAGDNQIFMHGCAVPCQFSSSACKTVCWTGVFSCDTAGVSSTWQWGAACYSNNVPVPTNICPKACQQTSCPNGLYYNQYDEAGCPENHKPYCTSGSYCGYWSTPSNCSY